VVFEADSHLREIGSKTFLDCSALKSIWIPASVTKLEYDWFEKCTSLSSVVFEPGSPLEGSAPELTSHRLANGQIRI
jgi:hypothetical protein